MSLSLSCATRMEERRKEAKTMAKVNLDDKLDKTVVGGDMVVRRKYKKEAVQVFGVFDVPNSDRYNILTISIVFRNC